MGLLGLLFALAWRYSSFLRRLRLWHLSYYLTQKHFLGRASFWDLGQLYYKILPDEGIFYGFGLVASSRTCRNSHGARVFRNLHGTKVRKSLLKFSAEIVKIRNKYGSENPHDFTNQTNWFYNEPTEEFRFISYFISFLLLFLSGNLFFFSFTTL